nr:MAG TPA: hypothetical protein [Caudoviricetes sp.]
MLYKSKISRFYIRQNTRVSIFLTQIKRNRRFLEGK